MSATAIQRRNLLIVGMPGVGKRTIANHILGTNTFQTSVELSELSSDHVITETIPVEERSIIYTIVIAEFGHDNNQVLQRTKEIFTSELASGVNLVLFVISKSSITSAQRATLEFVIGAFKQQLSECCALVVTGCDGCTEEDTEDFKLHLRTYEQKITEFMDKGIITVAFYEVVTQEEEIEQSEYEKTLRKLVTECGLVQTSVDMFRKSWWDRLQAWWENR